jgi:hypothetical protein
MKIPLLCPSHFTGRDGQHRVPTLADEKDGQIPACCRLTVCNIQMLRFDSSLFRQTDLRRREQHILTLIIHYAMFVRYLGDKLLMPDDIVDAQSGL